MCLKITFSYKKCLFMLVCAKINKNTEGSNFITFFINHLLNIDNVIRD